MPDQRHRNNPALGKNRGAASDRRTASRYDAKGGAIVIGWSEGQDYRTAPATLIDISLSGFAACVRTAPEPEGSVWLRLDGEKPSPWVEAKLIATLAMKSGGLFWRRRWVRLHLRFLEPCPYDVFKAAIEGFTRDVSHSNTMFKRYDGRYWR